MDLPYRANKDLVSPLSVLERVHIKEIFFQEMYENVIRI